MNKQTKDLLAILEQGAEVCGIEPAPDLPETDALDMQIVYDRVAASTSLKVLNLSNALSVPEVPPLARALKQNKSLLQLLLDTNASTMRRRNSLQIIIESLSSHPQLHTLSLAGCGVDDSGVLCICEMLQRTNLSVLNLSGNRVTAQGALMLVDAILKAQRLRSFSLRGNGIMSLEPFVKLLTESESLTHLNLSNTSGPLLSLEFGLSLAKTTTLTSLEIVGFNFTEEMATLLQANRT